MRKFGQLLLAGLLGSIITLGTYNLISKEDTTVKIEHQDNMPLASVGYSINENGEAVPLDFTAAAEKVTKAVVHIRSTSMSSGGQEIPEQFRRFFDNFETPQNTPRVGSGSGVLINEKGYIVTNNHVIADSDDLEVVLHDNRSFKAELIGTDPNTDIAVIKIEESGLPYLSFSNSENIKVGEWVLAVGNPYNLTSTVTAGIISAKARNIGILNNGSRDAPNESIESFIQTDAAVNPGNSGGALVNLQGGLIGINTAIASQTGSFSGYSFAVPSEIVSKVAKDLIEFGVVQRGWLGVVITSVNDALAKENDLEVIQGAYVTDLAETSGARDAGVKPGDVIVELDGREVKTNSDVIGYIGQRRPGDIIKIKVNRFGTEEEFDVKLKNRGGNLEPVKLVNDVSTKLGAEFEEVDSKVLKRLDLQNGVRVKSISSKGLIKKETSMREGFIITKVGEKPVKNVKELEKELQNQSGGVLIEGRYEQYGKTEYYAIGLN